MKRKIFVYNVKKENIPLQNNKATKINITLQYMFNEPSLMTTTKQTKL